MTESKKDDGDMTVTLPSEGPHPLPEDLLISHHPSLPSTSDCLTELLANIKARGVRIRSHLNGPNSQPDQSRWKRFAGWVRQLLAGQRNPVRLKNLEKVLAHLQVLQHMLAAVKIANPDETCQTLTGLLDQLQEPEKINFNNAWELADLLEAELLRTGDDAYIKGIWLTWPRNRKTDEIRDQVVKAGVNLADDAGTKKLSDLVRPWLLEDQRDLVQEYRRDRAMINLRRSYLNIMAIALLFLDLVFCWLFIAIQPAATQVTQVGPPNSTPAPTQDSSTIQTEPGSTETPSQEESIVDGAASATDAGEAGKLGTTWNGLLLIVSAGAIGSVLARSTRLSQQPLPSEANTGKANEMPLGIRSLMSTWSIFWAQIMLGATAALIAYLIFSSGLLNIEGLNLQTPSTLAVLSFIAGFSEPFLLNLVGKISGRVV